MVILNESAFDSDVIITLETLVSAFSEGSTAVDIVYQYPVLNLADVYAVITYYLRNKDIEEIIEEQYPIKIMG